MNWRWPVFITLSLAGFWALGTAAFVGDGYPLQVAALFAAGSMAAAAIIAGLVVGGTIWAMRGDK